jgi:hypothetical protein
VFDNVRVDGSASSDPEGMPLTYTWSLISQPAGSNVTLFDSTSAEVHFTPQVTGVYELGLVVNDSARNSPIARVDVNVFSSNESLVHRLDDSVLDAEYSGSLNKLVYIATNDTYLHILDLDDFLEQTVQLGQEAKTVGVSANGTHAAISHAGKVSLVNLQTATLVDSQNIPADGGDVVLDHNGRAHVIPLRSSSTELYSIDFTANSFTRTGHSDAHTRIRMHPVENWIYGADNSDFEKYDVSTYPPLYVDDAPPHGSDPIGGNIWISETGNHLLVARWNIFHSSAHPGLDMTHAGSLPDFFQSQWANHSAEAGLWAVMTQEDTSSSIESLKHKLFLYSDDVFVRQSVSSFSSILTPQGRVPASGNASSRVFFNANGDKIILITYNSGLVDEYAVEIRDLH